MFTGKKEYVTEVQVPLGHINMQAIILQAEVRILSEAMQIQGLLLIFIVYAMDGNIRYIRDTEFYMLLLSVYVNGNFIKRIALSFQNERKL